MVATLDLDSSAHCERAGSTPVIPTRRSNISY